MRKLFKLFLAFTLAFGLINWPKFEVKAYNEPVLKTFELVGFTNEILTESVYEVKYELAEGYEDVDVMLSMVFQLDNGDTIGVYFNSGFFMSDKDRYCSENYKFLYLGVSSSEFEEQYYSPYTIEELEALDVYVDEGNYYFYDIDYSFKLLDAEVDVTGPKVTDVTLKQDINMVNMNISYEDKTSVEDVKLTFSLADGSDEYEPTITSISWTQQELILELDLYQSFYLDNKYGEYVLKEIWLVDECGNSTTYDASDCVVVSRKEDNIRESYRVEDLIIKSSYVDNRVHFREENGVVYGNGGFTAYAYDKRGVLHFIGSGNVDYEDLEITKYNEPFSTNAVLSIFKYVDGVEEIIYVPNIEVEAIVYDKTIGKVINNTPIYEVCMHIDDYVSLDLYEVYLPITYELHDGTLVQEEAIFCYSHDDIETNELGFPVVYNMMYTYCDPKYEYVADQDVDGMNMYRVEYYLHDDSGNLVAFSGSILVDKDDRFNIGTACDELELTYEYGALPRLLDLEAKKVDTLDDLFKDFYVAYDVKLKTNYGYVQPAEKVEFTVELPEELKDEYVVVYSVDEKMNTKKIKSTLDGDSIKFKTDEVTTFVITSGVEKYSVTFVVDGEETVIEVEKGKVVTIPEFSKEGYYIDGWMNEYYEFVDLTKPITSNLVLYPNWIYDTHILKSFEIKNFQKSFKVGTSFEISYALLRDVTLYGLDVVYQVGNGITSYTVYDNKIMFDEHGYIQSSEAKFLGIGITYEENGEYKYAFYSKYDRQTLREIGMDLYDYGSYAFDKDYSYTYTDAKIDAKAPSVEDVKMVQNRDKVTITFTSDENVSGINNVEFWLNMNDEDSFFPIIYNDMHVEGNQYTVEYDLYYFYSYFPYGEYPFTLIVTDYAGNETIEKVNQGVYIREEDNRELTLTVDDLIIETAYPDNEFHFLYKDGVYYGNPDIRASYIGYCGDKFVAEGGYYTAEEIVASGDTFIFKVDLYSDHSDKVFEIPVKVNISYETKGEIYEFDEDYILPYTESAILDTYKEGTFIEPVKVKLHNGEITEVDAKVNWLKLDDGDGYYAINRNISLDPIYDAKDSFSEYNRRILLFSYTFIDDHKNVTDRNGNIVEKYEDMEFDTLLVEDDVIAIARRRLISLYSYLSFKDVTSEISGVDNEYRAYDLAYLTRFEEVQEVIDPIYIYFSNEALLNKPVNIYEVTTDGTKTLVDTVVLTEDYAYEYTKPVRLLLEVTSLGATNITLDKESLELLVKGTHTLKATIHPVGTEETIKWTSSNTKVATVDKNGKVTAKVPGTAIITATTENGLTAECVVTVKLQDVTTKVSRASDTSLKVSWNKVNGATGYEVYRSTSIDGTYKKVTTITKGTTVSWTNTKLTNGTTYFYKVRPYMTVSGKKYYGEYSDVVGYAALKTPSVTAKRTGFDSITLTWKTIKGAASYEIYRSTDNKNYELLTTTSAFSYFDNGLLTAKTYYYKVKAVKDCTTGNAKSAYSSYKSAKTTLDTPKVTITNPNFKTINLTWSAINGADGYEILRATKKDGKYAKLDETNLAYYEDANVVLGKTYYYKVRGYHNNEDGSKGYSSYSTIVNKKVAIVTPKVTVTNPNYQMNILDWQDVELATGYEVYRATSKSGKYTKVATVTESNYKDTNVVLGKTYYYKVRAVVDSNGTDKYSSYSSIVNKKVVIAAPKVSIPVFNFEMNALIWDHIEFAKEYEVYRATSKTGKYTKVATVLSSDYVDTTVVLGKTYYYKVRAKVDVNGTDKYSSYSTIVSKKVAFAKPTNFTAVMVNRFTARLEVDRIPGAEVYEYYMSRKKNGEFERFTSSTGNSVTESSQEYGTYYYKVRVYRVVNGKKIYSPFSDVQSVKKVNPGD